MSLVKYNKKRDFKKTAEPKSGKSKSGEHIFVVQRHHATRLHYDFRLEMDGVLKSWAVPKGPSLDPVDKRLAMEVEDHPFDYKDFEGEIPPGNYGAGYVYVWDKGTYELLDDKGNDFDKQALKEWKSGSVKVVLHGKKLKGEFALVKMRGGREENAWLMIKHRDRYAKEGYNSEDHTPQRVKAKLKGEANNRKAAAKTGAGKVAVKAVSGKSAAKKGAAKAAGAKAVSGKATTRKVTATTSAKKASKKNAANEQVKEFYKPMLATLVDEPFEREGWVFENKWDGYRVIANVVDGEASLYSRHQLSFNEIYAPIVTSVEKIPHNVVLDGEVVVTGAKGRSDFQALQNYKTTRKGKLVYEVFDLLHLDGHNLTDLTLLERKTLLEEIVKQQKDPALQYSKHVKDGLALFENAAASGWEGIIAKDGGSHYIEAARSMSWLKIKVLNRQEAVICGYTEPRGSRKKMGALILGVYEDGKLRYIGHCGGGFNEQSLKEMYNRLQSYRQQTSPFNRKIKTNTPVNWVKPELVCEVKFSSWTGDGLLRQPVFVAMREDKPAKEVKQELPKHLNMGTTTKEKKAASAVKAKAKARDIEEDAPKTKVVASTRSAKKATGSAGKNAAGKGTIKESIAKKDIAKKTASEKAAGTKSTISSAKKATGSAKKTASEKAPGTKSTISSAKKATGSAKKTASEKAPGTKSTTSSAEKAAPSTSKSAAPKKQSTKAPAEKERTFRLNNQTVTLTNQQKLYWPKEKITKGELIDYYMSVADTILPYLKDRPLSLNRYPNGINGPSFYQKDLDVEKSPSWLKTEPVMAESTGKQVDYLVCNNQATLAYMVNLGCIEINPWLSRISKPENPDFIVIDLDPEDIAFTHVVATANVVREILEGYDITSFVKTSGATGMHIYIPTGAKHEYETCKLFAAFIANETNARLPDTTSVIRTKSLRKKRVYVDFLQNRRGQTIASAYSARPKPGATVSTPLEWKEVNKKLNVADFHMGNTVSRLEKKGDLWANIMKTKNNLQSILKKQAT